MAKQNIILCERCPAPDFTRLRPSQIGQQRKQTNGFGIWKPESERVSVSQVLAHQLRQSFVGGFSHSVVLILQRLIQ